MNGREVAEALMALDDPDLPVLVETEWDVSSGMWEHETADGSVPVVGLRIEDGAIFFDKGEPTYCASAQCKYEGRHEGPAGELYCDGCHRQAEQEAEKIAAAQRKADAAQREANWKAAWRRTLTGVG